MIKFITIGCLLVTLTACQSHVASHQMSPQNRIKLQERLKEKCLTKGIAANSNAMKRCIRVENSRRDRLIVQRDTALRERFLERTQGDAY